MKCCKDCRIKLTNQNRVKNRLWCLSCRKKYMKAYNQRKEVKAKRLARKAGDRASLKQWLDDLKDNPCEDCKNKYPPIVMDWHHIKKKSPKAKYGMFRLAYAYGKAAVLAEIKKCVLLCANCHRLRHQRVT